MGPFVLTCEDDLGPEAPKPSSRIQRGVRAVMGPSQRAGWRLTHSDGHTVGMTTDHWDYRDAREWASREVKAIVGWTVWWIDCEGDRYESRRI